MEKGWEAPLKLDVTGRSTSELKPKQEWDKLDKIETNTQTLFIIFNGVNPDEFNRIATCKRAKKAWNILQVTHEGTSTMKLSNLQMFTSRFESVGMQENQTSSTFYVESIDIVNSSFNLGELIPNSKIIRKILRSLPKRFRLKVTTKGK